MDAERLRKVLELEARRGYDDRAVIGGLDAFLEKLADDPAVIGSTSPMTLKLERRRNGVSYASMGQKERRTFVDSLLELIGALESSLEPSRAMEVARMPVRARHAVPLPETETRPIRRHAVPLPGGGLDSPITIVKGINTALQGKFAKLGVNTVRDALYFFPHRHLDYSKLAPIASLRPGQEQTIIATVWESKVVRRGNRASTEAKVGDQTGNIRVIWFNQGYLAQKFHTNDKVVLSGRVNSFQGWLQMESPAWELVEDKELIHTGRLVPVYHLTAGLYPRTVRRLIKDAVDQWAPMVEDFLPLEVKSGCRLLNLDEAISQAHFPDSVPLKDGARERLAFDELFLLQLGVLSNKQKWQESQPGTAMKADRRALDSFLKALPFQFTGAQSRALQEILGDLSRPVAMSRLLQGDVGSGKTIVALAALMTVVSNGYQGAVMAPTEILAEQHFHTFVRVLSASGQAEVNDGIACFAREGMARPLTIALLTGSTKGKKALHGKIAEGAVDIVVGTHAVIQAGVSFPHLGMAVIDEQHRFGVEQRSALRQKGFNPHMLVMTATPIPRSLALTLYGDLDLSVIDELPPGRQKILTKWVLPEKRLPAYGFLKQEIEKGRQAFIICPLVEESESIETKAAVEEYGRLSQQVFPDLRLGLLHGRMASAKKEETMRLFRDHEMDILVSTSVVEVGIDVPNATVMLVEGADRFGLSQLHQFRGRVGRGSEKSYCLLLAEDPSPEGMERLSLIEKTHDGFKLAEEDLRLRGPGEFFGTRQSGLPDLRMARISDIALLEKARREAQRLFQRDPKLKLPQHLLLRKEMARVWKEKEDGEWS